MDASKLERLDTIARELADAEFTDTDPKDWCVMTANLFSVDDQVPTLEHHKRLFAEFGPIDEHVVREFRRTFFERFYERFDASDPTHVAVELWESPTLLFVICRERRTVWGRLADARNDPDYQAPNRRWGTFRTVARLCADGGYAPEDAAAEDMSELLESSLFDGAKIRPVAVYLGGQIRKVEGFAPGDLARWFLAKDAAALCDN